MTPYQKSWADFIDKCGEDTPDMEDEFTFAWKACKKEILKIIENTPLGYITESEHEKLEKFADLICAKISLL